MFVIGAGVAGLSAAVYLQRSGRSVVVVDPLPAATATSFGNAGLISPDTAVPVAMPGMLGKVPGWLLDRHGPLRIRPSYFPRALPWLLRWIEASRHSRVIRISDAMRMLHRDAFDCWHELVGAGSFSELIRTTGQVRASLRPEAASLLELALFERHGIGVKSLGEGELRDLYPTLVVKNWSAMMIPGNGHTANPHRLVHALADRLAEAGGIVLAERVLKIDRGGGTAGYVLVTDKGSHPAAQVVVAGGIWSKRLLQPLGIDIPLESERGYHATIPSPGIRLDVPLTIKDRGFVLTSMESGLRVAGTVEIAGVSAAADTERPGVLVQQARDLFPELQARTFDSWMGHRPSTPDTLPVVGEVVGCPGLFLNLGHGHFGMTGGPPSGKMIARLVNGERIGPLADALAPARF